MEFRPKIFVKFHKKLDFSSLMIALLSLSLTKTFSYLSILPPRSGTPGDVQDGGGEVAQEWQYGPWVIGLGGEATHSSGSKRSGSIGR